QSNALLAMGLIGGPVALFLIHQRLRSGKKLKPGAMIACAALATVGVVIALFVPLTRDLLFELLPSYLLLGLFVIVVDLALLTLARRLWGKGENSLSDERQFWLAMIVLLPFVSIPFHDNA